MNGLLFTDPATLAAAALAVALVGLSKGGLGGAMSLLGVGLLSLFMPPIAAAGLLLPILLVMDAVSLWAWRGQWDRRTLYLMLPGALIGLAIGWATAALVPEAAVRLIVGLIAFLFVMQFLIAARAVLPPPATHRPAAATFWSVIAGYTSFVVHAGGPPYQVYTVPLRQEPGIYTGTSVRYFAIVNILKLGPYIALGSIDSSNIMTSVALMPVAAVATLAGAAIVRRLRAEVFYPLMYGMIFLVSIKLIWDGVGDLI